MGGYCIMSRRVVPEIWKREGVLFKKWVEIGSGYGRGWSGNFVDGIYYIIASCEDPLYTPPSPCSYCGKESNYYIRKYKSDIYNLKRRPPAQAKDLSIVDKLLIIIPYLYTKCSNCGGEYGGYEENEFVKKKLGGEIALLTKRYDDESLLKMERVLQNLDNWNVEEILIREEDI
jgi:hypothetical protein